MPTWTPPPQCCTAVPYSLSPVEPLLADPTSQRHCCPPLCITKTGLLSAVVRRSPTQWRKKCQKTGLGTLRTLFLLSNRDRELVSRTGTTPPLPLQSLQYDTQAVPHLVSSVCQVHVFIVELSANLFRNEYR